MTDKKKAAGSKPTAITVKVLPNRESNPILPCPAARRNEQARLNSWRAKVAVREAKAAGGAQWGTPPEWLQGSKDEGAPFS